VLGLARASPILTEAHVLTPLQHTRQPIYLYINSAGVGKGGKLGYEAEALAIYDTMCHVKPPVRVFFFFVFFFWLARHARENTQPTPSPLAAFARPRPPPARAPPRCTTSRPPPPSHPRSLPFPCVKTRTTHTAQVRTLCVGTAYGEAAILLAAGEKGTRAALPSASIQLRQPMQRFAQMQASDVDIYRTELRKTKAKLFGLLSKHTGKTPRALERDLARPKYLNPYEAINYGVIDRVLAPGGAGAGKGGGAAEATAAAAAEAATKEMVMKSSYSTGLFDEVDAPVASE